MAVFSSKKGVSPLIATILLIAFAVALGSVVMNWGSNLYSNTDRCSGVKIELKNIGPYQVCYAGSGSAGYINFAMDNKGKQDINGFNIIMTDTTGQTTIFNLNDINVPKKTLFDKRDNQVVYDMSKYGQLANVEFTPKIKENSEVIVCDSKYNAKTEKIGPCF